MRWCATIMKGEIQMTISWFNLSFSYTDGALVVMCNKKAVLKKQFSSRRDAFAWVLSLDSKGQATLLKDVAVAVSAKK